MIGLNELQQKYPSALYSFFSVPNLLQVMDVFLSDTSRAPQLHVSSRLNRDFVHAHLDDLQSSQHAIADDTDATNFLNRRLQEARVLKSYLDMRENEVEITADAVTLYRQLMVDLYGEFDTELFGSALWFVHNLARKKGILLDKELGAMCSTHGPFRPTGKVFQHYRGLAKRISPKIFLHAHTDDETPVKIFERALDGAGLKERGWSVLRARQGANILVAKYKKIVYVGPHFTMTTPLRMKQLIAHEIYGHAVRSELGTIDVSSREEEGIAILLEQLVATRFMYKRMIRYLTLCFAWGVDGTPRNFVDTYRTMLPIIQVIAGSKGRKAEEICFKECVRTFRGGIPSLAGAVFSKDKVYFEANIALWRKLSDRLLNEDEFRAVLQKRATIFGEEQI